MTQVDAARELEVHQPTISQWETGRRVPRGLARRFLEQWIAEAPSNDDGEEVAHGRPI